MMISVKVRTKFGRDAVPIVCHLQEGHRGPVQILKLEQDSMSARTIRRAATPSLSQLYQRPGFLLRRANQIALSIATRESARIGLTPPQHACLIALESYPGLDQINLGKVLGIDRATIGQVLRRLEARKLVKRVGSSSDARRKVVTLTDFGKRLVGPASEAARRTADQLLSGLKMSEQKALIGLLTKLVTALNEQSPAPLESPTDLDD